MPVQPINEESLAEAARHLAAGRLVAFPTETVYGLGGDAGNDQAVAAIFAAKGRPSFNPLIVHVPDLTAAERLVRFDARARLLARLFWPGPLTLVLPREEGGGISLLASAGLDSLAIRVPAHPAALALLKASGRPLAAPSANPSGRISPTTARHVADGLADKVAMILDGGPCRIGIESSVLDLTGPVPVLLRPGGATLEQLEAALGPVALGEAPDPDGLSEDGILKSPGLLSSHYAPALPLRIEAQARLPGEALLGFGPAPGADLNLSAQGDLAEAAANLFSMLRALDKPEWTGIAVMPVPQRGLGLAINDRLRRAAAPRPLSRPDEQATSRP